MSEQDNIKLIDRFCAAWSGPKVDVPAILEFFTEDAVYHNMPIQPIQGQDAIKGVIEQFMTPFERCDWRVLHVAASGDTVLTERVDKFLGAKNVELPVMGAFDIKDGKISAWRDYFDLGAWTKQMA